MPAPLQIGQSLTLDIQRLGAQGDGVAYVDDFPIFIPYSLPHERVIATIHHLKSDAALASLTHVATPSSARQSAPCMHFLQCGGCNLQHLTPLSYESFKTHLITDILSQIGADTSVIRPLVHGSAFSRRRAEFKVQVEKGQVRLGFMSARSHRVIHLSMCPLLEPILFQALAPLHQCLQSLTRPSALSSIRLTRLARGLDVECQLAAPLKKADQQRLHDWAASQSVIRLSTRASSDEHEILYAQGEAEIEIANYAVPFPQNAFLQASSAAQESITERIIKHLAVYRHIVDLYCGLGTYSLPLVQHGHQVRAYEGDSEMITALYNTIHRYHLQEKLGVHTRDLHHSPLTAKEFSGVQAAVINPPRNGAMSQIKHMAASNLRCIIMVSCNPATFARDAALLIKSGFRLCELTPIDQFYWSHHLEVVGVFRK
ncbi:MAG: 23S rRNA (uracil(1939)-C(5))-methyltransferase RlmD [Rickettsiales bacterium]|nr:23S rRNA (uracil(1939)-C(5))-methyltransferase RlmD [Rickettsiales bacterium]